VRMCRWVWLTSVVTAFLTCSDCDPVSVPLSASCSANPVTATQPDSVSAAGSPDDGSCVSVTATFPWQSGDAGSACSDPLDCAPVCCPCPNGNVFALSTWCNNGACADPE